MKYCECDKPFSDLKPRPFLHVRVRYPWTTRYMYLHDINRMVIKAERRCWELNSDKAMAYIFQSVAEAKCGLRRAAVRRAVEYSDEQGLPEISCRWCDGVVFPKSVLVQIAEVVGEDSGL